MSEQHQLYINGEWIETEASVANTSPSDTDRRHWSLCSGFHGTG